MAPVTPFARSYAHSDIRAAGMYVFGMTGMATARVISAPPPLPSRYIEKNYHIMQIRARPVTLPAKGSRMATFGISRYLGEEEGGKKRGRSGKAEFRNRRSARPWRICMRGVSSMERWYRILTIRRKNVTIIFGECRSNDGCIINWLRGKLRKENS